MQGIDSYNKRAEGAVGLKADPGNINRAISLFEKEYQNPENQKTAGLYLMRCYNYKGRFVLSEESEQEAIFKKGKDLGETLVEKFPNDAAIRFEYICLIGLWADKAGVMQAAWDGVLGKMKDNTEKLITIDEAYAGYAGDRILGILYYQAPHIPFVLTWPSDEKAKELLGKSVKNAPDEFGSNYYYAEVLDELGEKAEAKKYLNKVLEMKPRPELYLEDLSFQDDAKKLLKKIE